MRCPFCGNADTQVVDSRVSEEGDTIRRRRRCLSCDKRFTTYERVELAMPSVVKRDGSRTEYDAGKVRGSLSLALRKRPVSTDEVDSAVARIEETLLASGMREVPSEQIGELVMGELKRLDKVAYVRYASVYKSFEDIGEFVEAIREMQGPCCRARNCARTRAPRRQAGCRAALGEPDSWRRQTRRIWWAEPNPARSATCSRSSRVSRISSRASASRTRYR